MGPGRIRSPLAAAARAARAGYALLCHAFDGGPQAAALQRAALEPPRTCPEVLLRAVTAGMRPAHGLVTDDQVIEVVALAVLVVSVRALHLNLGALYM